MAVLYTQHFVQFFDDNGNPLSGGRLYTYDAGGTTPKATYSDAAGATANANPVVLDAAGRATVFLDGTTYRFDLKTSGDVLVRSTDNIQSFGVTQANITNTSLALMPANSVKANTAATSNTPSDLSISTNSLVGRLGGNLVSIDANQFRQGGYINGFRNPFMEVAQRGTSGSVTAGGGAYTLDGWAVSPVGANVTWQRSGSITSGTVYAHNSLGLLGASGLSACTVTHRIESAFASQFSGKRATIQFLIQNQTGAALTPIISTYYPAVSDDNYGSATTDLGITNLQTIASGATAIVAYTFDTNFLAARGYGIDLRFGNQLNGAGKNVFISAADIRYTPDTPVGLNSAPPRPEYRPRGPETLFCQRYYCVFGPVTAMFPWASGTQIIRVHASFPVVMRSSPSVTMGTKLAGTGTLSANNVTPYGVAFAGSGSIQDVLVYTDNIASSEL
jgi:hypothetical protein